MPFPEYTPNPTQLATLAEADDDEPLAAATTNVSLEQLADGIAWLNQNRVIQVVGDFFDDNDTSPAVQATFSNTASYTTGLTFDVNGVLEDDTIVVRAVLLCTGDFATSARLRLTRITGVGGTPSSEINIPGATAIVTQLDGATDWIQVVLQGSLVADRDGAVRINVNGRIQASGDLEVMMYHIVCEHYRLIP